MQRILGLVGMGVVGLFAACGGGDPGATLEDSARAADLALTADDLRELDGARSVSGNRYGEMGMRMVRL